MTVPDGIAELIDGARRRGRFDDPFDAPLPEHPPERRSRSSTCGSSRRTSRRSRTTLRSGWLTHGPADGRRSRRRSPSTSARSTRSRSPAARRRCTSPTWPRASGPGDEVIVPAMTFAATAAAVDLLRRDAGVRRHRSARTTSALDPEDVERRITPRTKAVCVVHFAGYAAAVDALRELCDEHGHRADRGRRARARAPTLDGRKLGTWGLAGAFSFFSNKVLSVRRGRPAGHRRRRGRRARALAALARHDVRHVGPPHAARPTTYDVVGARLQLPPRRAARGAAALAPARGSSATSRAAAS